MKTRLAPLGFMLLVLLIGAFQHFAARFGGLAANQFGATALDPDKVFIWISLHHIVQACLALLLMFGLSRVLKIDWRLGAGDVQAGKRFFGWFLVGALGYVLVGFLPYLLGGAHMQIGFPSNARNFAGSLAFQLFLSGPSEEILFRAFPIALLCHFFPWNIRLGKWNLSLPVLVAALLFGLAHLQLTLWPCSVSGNWGQAVFAALIGVIYGIAYLRTRSVLYPILMHSSINLLMVGGSYLLQLK